MPERGGGDSGEWFADSEGNLAGAMQYDAGASA